MSSLLFLTLSHRSPPCLRPQFHSCYCYHQHHPNRRLHFLSRPSQLFSLRPMRGSHSPGVATVSSNEGAVSIINFEEYAEKDWSFLDPDEAFSEKAERIQKFDRIISAGGIGETSRVLVSISSEGFVDRMIESSPCDFLLLVHDSLLVLACIKEKYDKVKCWQGELIYVPKKWMPFDVLFLYFLPALPFELGQIFGALAQYCSPGARVVICHPHGREGLEKQRQQYRDVVISDLPERTTLQNACADHTFELTEFVDESDFYLVVLKYCKAKSL